MGTTNQKSTVHTHTQKEKAIQTNTKDRHQITREENKITREKKIFKNIPKTINKMARTFILIITLNINGLNASTKRHRLDEWIQNQHLYICYLQENHFRYRDTYRLRMKGGKKVFHAKENQKKPGVATHISGKIDFKIKNVKGDKEEHYIIIKGSIQEEDITIINIYIHPT